MSEQWLIKQLSLVISLTWARTSSFYTGFFQLRLEREVCCSGQASIRFISKLITHSYNDTKTFWNQQQSKFFDDLSSMDNQVMNLAGQILKTSSRQILSSISVIIMTGEFKTVVKWITQNSLNLGSKGSPVVQVGTALCDDNDLRTL